MCFVGTAVTAAFRLPDITQVCASSSKLAELITAQHKLQPHHCTRHPINMTNFN